MIKNSCYRLFIGFFIFLLLISGCKKKPCCDYFKLDNKDREKYLIYTYSLDTISLGERFMGSTFVEKGFFPLIDHYESEDCIPDTTYVNTFTKIVNNDTIWVSEEYFFCSDQLAVYTLEMNTKNVNKHNEYIKNILKKYGFNKIKEKLDVTYFDRGLSKRLIIDEIGTFNIQLKHKDNYFWDNKL